MHKTIVSIKYFPYLCIRQLVILIYIYHFPKRNKPSVRIAYFFSVHITCRLWEHYCLISFCVEYQ